MSWTKATWTDGKRKITGRWNYYWPSDTFYVHLDSKDPITGRHRSLDIKGEKPEWGKWKLVEIPTGTATS